MTTFGWSLYEINQTDICDLLRFVSRLKAQTKGKDEQIAKPGRIAYCDEVPFL